MGPRGRGDLVDDGHRDLGWREQLGEHRGVAGPARAKVKVVADDHGDGLEPGAEEALGEGLR